MTKLSALLIVLTCCAALLGRAPAAEPALARIKGLQRMEGTVVRLGGEGDNWHMSWTNDDRLVAGLCDGTAEPWPKVPHRLYNSRLISVRGVPPKLEFSD